MDQALKDDDLKPLEDVTATGHLIAVFLERNGRDYHCLRLDNNSYWSHKLSHAAAVTSLDNHGKAIVDVHSADLFYGKGNGEMRLIYDQFVGYYRVPPNLHVSPGEKRTKLPSTYSPGLGR